MVGRASGSSDAPTWLMADGSWLNIGLARTFSHLAISHQPCRRSKGSTGARRVEAEACHGDDEQD